MSLLRRALHKLLIPKESDQGSRAVMEAMIDTAVDVTHENGSELGTARAVIGTYAGVLGLARSVDPIAALLALAEDVEQTPEEAEQELRAMGVDVDGFLSRARERRACSMEAVRAEGHAAGVAEERARWEAWWNASVGIVRTEWKSSDGKNWTSYLPKPSEPPREWLRATIGEDDREVVVEEPDGSKWLSADSGKTWKFKASWR